jgi:hypothetical protein
MKIPYSKERRGKVCLLLNEILGSALKSFYLNCFLLVFAGAAAAVREKKREIYSEKEFMREGFSID